MDWERIYHLTARPLIVDGRNLLEPAAMKGLRVQYYSFGRLMENLTPAFAPEDALVKLRNLDLT